MIIRNRLSRLAPLSIISFLALAALGAAASGAERPTVMDGVYTAEQAEEGKAPYEQRCASCHNADFYKNSLTNRNGQMMSVLFEEILVTMPADNPGSLMDHEYEAILAHVFSLVGYPAGEEKLEYSSGTMHTIQIVAPPEE